MGKTCFVNLQIKSKSVSQVYSVPLSNLHKNKCAYILPKVKNHRRSDCGDTKWLIKLTALFRTRHKHVTWVAFPACCLSRQHTLAPHVTPLPMTGHAAQPSPSISSHCLTLSSLLSPHPSPLAGHPTIYHILPKPHLI